MNATHATICWKIREQLNSQNEEPVKNTQKRCCLNNDHILRWKVFNKIPRK